MDPLLGHADLPLAAMDLAGWLNGLWQFTKVLIGFSLIIFVHELGHFLAAKWCGVRVHRFAVGFGPRVFGYRSGEGLTFGGKPNYTPEEIQEKGYGETDYCLNILPLGGYVKMMGESDFDIDDETGEINVSDDPRAFSNRPVSSRMTVVSAGVVFNLLFSAIAFMSVFLIGLDMPVPVVGSVLASSPADRAGLLPGDEIISINGHAVDSWRDVVMRESLANGPLSFEIVRDGAPLPGPITITPEDDPIDRMPSIGAAQKNIPYVGADYPPDAEEPILLKQDRILRVNGEVTESLSDFTSAMMRTRGAPYTITVARAPQDNPDGEDQEVTVNVDSELMIRSDVFALTRAENMKLEPPNILGFAPRVAVADVTRGRPAEDAGLKHGDVITRVGPIANPTMPLIFRVIGESKMQPIEMEILRGEETKIVTVRPEPVDRVKPWGDKSPFIGLDPNWLEQDRVVIADVIAGSVAANAGVPRGATVLRVNDREVGSWTEFVLALLDNAGKRVALNVDSGGQKLDLAFEVPSSVVNELDLPPDVDFLAVNGAREITVDGVKKTIRTSSAFAAALQQNIGKEITLEFADHLGLGTAQKRTFTVTEENWQPWQLQAQFRTPLVLSVRPVLHKVDAGGNPLRAINMAGKMTYQNVIGTYQSMRQVANKKVSTENLSGPVGIFSVAMTVAEHGFAELLFLLGFLSANLAVINFLPLPVMDGGLMAFLILEKIRGKPVTVKTQMISTMVGLAVIGLIFIAVTFQDVAKLFP